MKTVNKVHIPYHKLLRGTTKCQTNSEGSCPIYVSSNKGTTYSYI